MQLLWRDAEDDIIQEMDPSNRRSPVTALLVGLVVVIGLAVLAMVFVPIAECPLCKGQSRWMLATETNCVLYRHDGCQFCEGACKVTFLKKWTYRPAAQPQ